MTSAYLARPIRVSALVWTLSDSAKVLHKPCLLSDNGSPYVAGDLAEYLEHKGMKLVRGASMHLLPGDALQANRERAQIQGKIESWYPTLKTRILLKNDVSEGELKAALAAFIDNYNNRRDHESIGHLTPAEVRLRLLATGF